MPCTPDVLVLCSQIRYFASAVDNVLCVNPGRVTQGTSGGTYAKLAVHPAPTSFFQTRALPGSAARALANASLTRVDLVCAPQGLPATRFRTRSPRAPG